MRRIVSGVRRLISNDPDLPAVRAGYAVMEKAAREFSLGMVNVISFFVPDVLVLSGGVMKSADIFLPALAKMLQTPNPMVPFASVRILPARRGYYAALYGGAYMILHQQT